MEPVSVRARYMLAIKVPTTVVQQYIRVSSKNAATCAVRSAVLCGILLAQQCTNGYIAYVPAFQQQILRRQQRVRRRQRLLQPALQQQTVGAHG